MTPKKVAHLTLDERRENGRKARRGTPRSSHEGWEPAADRPRDDAIERDVCRHQQEIHDSVQGPGEEHARQARVDGALEAERDRQY